MLAAMTSSPDITNQVILKCQDRGLILFGSFLKVVPYVLPPLTISLKKK
jgi:hypothetical protein